MLSVCWFCSMVWARDLFWTVAGDVLRAGMRWCVDGKKVWEEGHGTHLRAHSAAKVVGAGGSRGRLCGRWLNDVATSRHVVGRRAGVSAASDLILFC